MHTYSWSRKRKDLTGRKFGRLRALRFTHDDRRRLVWICHCDCGTTVAVRHPSRRRSCGCLRHFMTGTAEHTCWIDMRQRCENPKNRSYKNYGGRGIKVCRRWRSFRNFLADMGKRPTPQHSIERIKNMRGYSPSNCEWATKVQQLKNRRSWKRLKRPDTQRQTGNDRPYVTAVKCDMSPKRHVGSTPTGPQGPRRNGKRNTLLRCSPTSSLKTPGGRLQGSK